MPAKTKRRTRKVKAALTAEEQHSRDQCELFLKDFDKNVDIHVKEAAREMESLATNINTMFKLEMMKIPQETKKMKWQDFFRESLDLVDSPVKAAAAMSNAINDSICATVDAQVNELKSVITTAKKRGRNKKTLENDYATAPRTSSRNRTKKEDMNFTYTDTVTRTSSRNRTRGLTDTTNLETPAGRGGRRGGAGEVVATPANTRPPHWDGGATPMITPKFDTMAISRTVRRVARGDEMLLSMSGSPVAPAVSNRTKAGKNLTENNVAVPLGGGETLNIPLGADGALPGVVLDDDQARRIRELRACLDNMLEAREQAGLTAE